MTDEEDRYGGTCDVCLSPSEHRVWCQEGGGGPELARPDNCTVGIDHEQFPAYVDPAEPLWNGAVAPGFSAAVADQVVAWLNDCYARDGDCSDRAEWDGDVIVVHSPNYEGAEGVSAGTSSGGDRRTVLHRSGALHLAEDQRVG